MTGDKRARHDALAGLYHQTLTGGITDPVKLDLIIDQVLSAWSSDIADYETLCNATELLDPHAREQLVAALRLQAKEET